MTLSAWRLAECLQALGGRTMPPLNPRPKKLSQKSLLPWWEKLG